MRTSECLVMKTVITLSSLFLYLCISSTVLSAEVTHSDLPIIHIHQASSDSANVNAYIIETDNALILIDTLLTSTDYIKLKNSIKSFKKPLKAVFISHPHPDHYNNIHTLKKDFEDIAIYSSSKTHQLISSNDAALRGYWKGIYQNDYPETLDLPNRTIPSTGILDIEGLDISIKEYNAAEAGNQIVFYFEKTGEIILADLVSNGVHPYLNDSDIKGWIETLEKIKKTYPNVKTVYPGHGNRGDIQLITKQIDYLNTLWSETAKRVHPENEEEPLSQQSSAEIIDIISRKFPSAAGYYLSMGMKKVSEQVIKTMPITREEPFMY